MVKKKDRGFFKELIYAWKNDDSPHIGFGGLGAVAVWLTSSIVASFVKKAWLNINLFYIFIPIYFILISLTYFMVDKRWRKTTLVRSFLFMAIFLVLLSLIVSIIFHYIGINLESIFSQL